MSRYIVVKAGALCAASAAPLPVASLPAPRRPRGLLPLVARRLRRRLSLFFLILLVGVIPAALALVRRAGTASSR